MESTETTGHCPFCGGRLAAAASAGFCVRCLLEGGLGPPSPPAACESDITAILLRPAAADGVRFHAFGDYELLEEIARGGMGVVFKVRQVSLNRIVALKFIHPGRLSSAEAVRRFHIEAQAAAQLEHPNIVPIYEVGEHGGNPFFTMPLMTGGTLARRVSGAGARLSDRKSAALIARVARAIDYAHRRGIIHRDLKPGNILLDGQGEPHLTDFGLAKVLTQDQDPTQSLTILGTPQYMAPEQAEGNRRELGPPTDVYGLGAILFELLTGRPPFLGNTPVEVLRRVLHEEPAPLRRAGRLNPADRDLETICQKCLRKEPKERYGSAAALADDLENWLEGRPIHARPLGIGERTWRWGRQRPATAALALVCVVALGSWCSPYLRGPKTTTAYLDATDVYWKGREAWNRRTVNGYYEARKRFQEALTIDPQYLLAWVGLADVNVMGWLFTDEPPGLLRTNAHLAVGHALEQSPRRAEAHATLGFLLSYYDWDWQNAFREFDCAIQLNREYTPAYYWHALTLVRYGRTDEAISEARRGQTVDPNNAVAGWYVGSILYYSGQYREATNQLHRTLGLEPGFAYAQTYLGMSHLAMGQVPEAVRWLEDGRKISPWTWSRVWLAAAYALSSDPADRVKLDELLEPVRNPSGGYASVYPLAIMHAVRGETDQALDYLDQEYANHSPAITWIKIDWPFNPMRAHPRFKALVKKVGLPE